MILPLLFWIMIAGGAASMIAAIAVWVIKDISWHERGEYCNRKKRPELFSRIYDFGEQLQLGAEITQQLSTAVTTVAGVGWFLGLRSFTDLTMRELACLLILVALALVCVNSWIPWAIARIG